jgi:alkylhydroperoxidase family enzyme
MRLLLDGTLERRKGGRLDRGHSPELFGYASSTRFSAREKAALHYADLFKQGEHAIDKDQVYADLAKHFSDEEIIELGLFCAEVDGVGKFVTVATGRPGGPSIGC